MQANAQQVNIQIDTHAASIHSSVDSSLVKIGESLNDTRITKVDERKLEVKRDDEWNKEINNTITNLKERLESLNETQQISTYIQDTLSKTDKIDEEIKKFKYKIEVALSLINGIEQGTYGNHYKVDANFPANCGFSAKEIVAIAYRTLLEKDNWENPELEKQHFMMFVEGLYDAKKGYNIDKYLKDDVK